MYRHVPFVVVTLGLGTLIAGILLLIGGLLAGWDIAGALTSRMAYLLYAIMIAYIVVGVFTYFTKNDMR